MNHLKTFSLREAEKRGTSYTWETGRARTLPNLNPTLLTVLSINPQLLLKHTNFKQIEYTVQWDLGLDFNLIYRDSQEH